MVLVLKLILAVIIGTNALPFTEYEKEWNTFLLNFNRHYRDPTEFEYRKQIFLTNLRSIRKHNTEYELGLHTYRKGINQFTDRSSFEKRVTLQGFTGSAIRKVGKRRRPKLHLKTPNEAPESIDWRAKGAVTRVKDQDDCGSCWAFSTIGSLEGQYFLATNNSVNFSEQQLIDCSKSNFGCEGGDMEAAYSDLRKIGGIATEASYPYRGSNRRCKYKTKMGIVRVIDYEAARLNEEEALKKFVALHGPLSIAIEATHNFFEYTGGIFFDKTCTDDLQYVNHAVLLVGYGSENGTDYWTVKNSWGERWGEKGYIKMSRNKKNNCQIASYASYPIIKILNNNN